MPGPADTVDELSHSPWDSPWDSRWDSPSHGVSSP